MVSLLSLNAFDLALTEKLLAGSLFGTANPQLRLPYFFTADVGPTEIELLADELVLGIGAVL